MAGSVRRDKGRDKSRCIGIIERRSSCRSMVQKGCDSEDSRDAGREARVSVHLQSQKGRRGGQVVSKRLRFRG